MGKTAIRLGTVEEVEILYAYPNNKKLGWTLCQTVEHWFGQTLARDGYNPKGRPPDILATASEDSGQVTLTLSARDDLTETLQKYDKRMSNFLAAGWEAYTTVIPELKKSGKWDPRHNDWRFFLPMGLPMVNEKSLQFFHYPPNKMLEAMQDYLDDPVPYRVEDLLCENGVPNRAAAQEFEAIIDGAPIAAPDDAGSAQGFDPEWGLIPIQYFKEYQRSMVLNLLNPSLQHPGYTIPIIVYGTDPRKIFGMLFMNGETVEINKPITVEILPGLTTPVIGAHHPYNFYWSAQFEDNNPNAYVGDGRMVESHCTKVLGLMIGDLISARWQAEMARDPSQDGVEVMKTATEYWNAPENVNIVCALTQSQATLLYLDAAKTKFTFRVDVPEAKSACESHGDQTCAFVV